ncbi:uncharacterized protein LOC120252911 [Dioscorea cayenensis subsp. rotundata]|uniref:Uncharacterized protein LOC120252911 n=1 Tax=Dioscorea cayennensis subsp. rotundata TaxID=55577 RepID=A0AB40AQF9_DIOCR|nr:uncharacterized protein LOC120252911 [Dioscorea cayenensis subsp. rotundata]
MHAKTDSEVTSIAPSSPTRSPRRPVYYVQSPSRDSHDGEKTTASFHSTPVLSPTGSPPHSNSSVGHHSRESSSSRFSGSLKPGSRKVTPNDTTRTTTGASRKGGGKHWKECAVIEEEGLLDDEDDHKGVIPKKCYFLAFILGFFILFTLFSLILWGASKSQKPQISLKSMKFENFIIQAGTDATLVPTDMVTMNSTLMLTFKNTATFFGVHVTSTPVNLNYYELTLATGDIKEFYQSRKSQRTLNVVVVGNRIPLYGGGASLTSSNGKSNNSPVPLNLSFQVRSRAYVLGKLVKPKFYINVQCSLVLNQNKLNTPVSLKNSCQYS